MTCQKSVTTSTRKILDEVKAKLQRVTFSDVEYQAEKLIRKLMGRPNHCSTLANYVTGKDSEGFDFGKQKSFRFRLIPEERGYPNSVLYDYIITSGGSITKRADDPYAVTILNDLYYILREDEDIQLPSDCYSSSLIYEAIKREMFDLPLPDPKAHLLTPSKYEPHDLWKILRREQKWSDLKEVKEEVETKPVTARKCARMIYEILSADKNTILKWKEVCGIEKSPSYPPSTSAEFQEEENQEKKKHEAISSSMSYKADDPVNANAAVVSQEEGIGREDEEVTSGDKEEMKRRDNIKDRATTAAIILKEEGGPSPQPLSKMTLIRRSNMNATVNRSAIASKDVQDQMKKPNPGEEKDPDVLLSSPPTPTSTSLDPSRKINKRIDRATATTIAATSPQGGDPHPRPEITVTRRGRNDTTSANRSRSSIAVDEVQGQAALPNPEEEEEDDFPSSPTSTSTDGTYSRKNKYLDQHELVSVLMVLTDDDETNSNAAAAIETVSPGNDSHRQESIRSSDYDNDLGFNTSLTPKGNHPQAQFSPERKRQVGDNNGKVSASTVKASISGNVQLPKFRSISNPEDENEENEEELFVPVPSVIAPRFHFSAPVSPSPEEIIPRKKKKSDENNATAKAHEIASSSPLPVKEKMFELSSIMSTPEGQRRRRQVHVTPENIVKPRKRKSAEIRTRILERSSSMNTPEPEGQRQVQIGHVAPSQRNAVPEPLASSTPRHNISVNRSVPGEDTSGGNVDVEEEFRRAGGTPVSARFPVQLQKRRKSTTPPPSVPATRQDSSEPEVEFSEEEEDEKSLRKSKDTRREYFKEYLQEEYLIVKKICEAKAFLNPRAGSIYQAMAETKEFKDRRTWTALRDRFMNYIEPQLQRLSDDEHEIRKYAKKCGIPLEDFKELLKGLEISSKRRGRRKAFTTTEEYLIVRKICEVKGFLYTGGHSLFKDMAKSKDFNGRRTGPALSDRFKRFIRPKLLDETKSKSFAEKCGISSNDMKELLEGLRVTNMKISRHYAPKYNFD